MSEVIDNFTIGQKVNTPQGAGVIKEIRVHAVIVLLTDTKEEVTVEKAKISDDSDAG